VQNAVWKEGGFAALNVGKQDLLRMTWLRKSQTQKQNTKHQKEKDLKITHKPIYKSSQF
jgi:hypothetical protein